MYVPKNIKEIIGKQKNNNPQKKLPKREEQQKAKCYSNTQRKV